MKYADDLALMFSGGKDSMAAFMTLAETAAPRWLVTTCSDHDRRIAIHGTRVELVQRQAERMGCELVIVGLPDGCDNATYRTRIAAAAEPLLEQGLRRLAFGDLFLGDIRAFRETQCAALGLKAEFPIWGRDPRDLAERLPGEGLDARVCSVDAERIDPAELGARWSPDWLARLDSSIDPCGENGEFHTLVVDAPLFHSPIRVTPGEVRISVQRFHMLDLCPT
ncbi:ATP-binding protein [Wenzhouxiangella sp. XN79A]|uniref:Dph6-related ATP pyrophosphatase n=1 Tax=Wenzhouxiangella sp. XN79A TaxID=2724193 RepID=UPI00144ACB1A|nr:ATP-binding protein [Wenzhouxiangella sp. XN79A]NKI36506.1 ATP-binding protein [Wenzhouxiangella sp. XN79A]